MSENGKHLFHEEGVRVQHPHFLLELCGDVLSDVPVSRLLDGVLQLHYQLVDLTEPIILT